LAIKRIWDFSSRRRSALYRRLIKAAVVGYLTVDVLIFLGLTRILAMIASYAPAANAIH
jgi:hypothetical protein